MMSKHHWGFLLRLLLGLIVLLWSAPAEAQDAASAVPDSVISQTAPATPDSEASSSLPPAQRDSDFRISIDSESGDGVDSVFEFIAFLIFLSLLVAVATAFAGGFAAVSIFMDTGCLRMLIAALGWGIAVLSGLVVGLLMGSAFGGMQAFLMIGLFGGGFLYLAAWQRGHQRAQQLSEADRLTWKHTLTGGALIGTGAGSVANLARSAGVLFKGGGGGFGGGGASGTFGGAQAGVGAPGAVALGPVGMGGSPSGDASGGEPATRSQPGSAAASADNAASSSAPRWCAWMRAAVQPLQRFRWYHGVAFVLIGVVFMPVGMGLAAILRSGRLLLGLALVGLCLRGYVGFIITERYKNFHGIGLIVLLVLIAVSIWLTRYSTAPYWHLGLVGVAVLTVVLYRSRGRDTSVAKPDSAASFEGGSASDAWT